jgi:hypothetical protein
VVYFESACARVKCIVFKMYCTSILAEAWYMQRDPKKNTDSQTTKYRKKRHRSDVRGISRHLSGTGWRRPIGYFTTLVLFRKLAMNYRAFWRKMTYKDKALYRADIWCFTTRVLFRKLPQTIGLFCANNPQRYGILWDKDMASYYLMSLCHLAVFVVFFKSAMN